MESLHRLRYCSDIDLCIIDECESVFDQFDSPNHKERGNSFGNFAQIMHSNAKVIFMDANVQNRTYDMLARMRKGRSLVYHYNKFYRAKEDIYNFTTQVKEWLEALIIAINRDQKIVIPVNSIKFANQLEALLRDEYPTKRIQLYSSETNASTKKEHFADVKTFWKQFDILIYTPTLTAGVSFEEEHYDILFGFFMDCSCNVEACRQMLGRVRNLKTKTHNICFKYSGMPKMEEDPEVIRNMICNYRLEMLTQSARTQLEEAFPLGIVRKENLESVGLGHYYDSDMANLIYMNISNRAKSQNNFMKLFVLQVAASGAQIDVLEDQPCSGIDFGLRMTEYQAEFDKAKNENIAAAKDLTYGELEALKEEIRVTGRDTTLEERASIDRFYLKNAFDINDGSYNTDRINLQFVELLNCEDMKEIYKNLKILSGFRTVKDAIDNIRFKESKRMEGNTAFTNLTDRLTNSQLTDLAFDLTNGARFYTSLKHSVMHKLLDKLGLSFNGREHTNKQRVYHGVRSIVKTMGNLDELITIIRNTDKHCSRMRIPDMKDWRTKVDTLMFKEVDSCNQRTHKERIKRFVASVIKWLNTCLEKMYGRKVQKIHDNLYQLVVTHNVHVLEAYGIISRNQFQQNELDPVLVEMRELPMKLKKMQERIYYRQRYGCDPPVTEDPAWEYYAQHPEDLEYSGPMDD